MVVLEGHIISVQVCGAELWGWHSVAYFMQYSQPSLLVILAPHLAIFSPQGTYDECSTHESFARLLREHNADHSTPDGEAEEVLPPGEPLAAAESARVLMRADTAAISARAAAEALGAGGRSAGDASVQHARLAAAPTFVARPVQGGAEKAGDRTAEGGTANGTGKFGKQLARFETMIQQNLDGKKDKGGEVGAGLGCGSAGHRRGAAAWAMVHRGSTDHLGVAAKDGRAGGLVQMGAERQHYVGYGRRVRAL